MITVGDDGQISGFPKIPQETPFATADPSLRVMTT